MIHRMSPQKVIAMFQIWMEPGKVWPIPGLLDFSRFSDDFGFLRIGRWRMMFSLAEDTDTSEHP